MTFWVFFFPNRPGGHTPRPILTQNASNDVGSRAFWSKNRNFLKPLTPRSPKPPKFAQFWSGLRKFSLDFAFNIGGLTSKHRSSSEPNKSVIVNRQCVGGKFKYVPKVCIGGTGHVISRMRNDDLHRSGNLEANISKLLEIEVWSQEGTNRKRGMRSRMVT